MVWSDCVIVRLTAAGVLVLASLSGRHCHVVADCHFVPGSLQALNGSHCEISIAVSIFLFFCFVLFCWLCGTKAISVDIFDSENVSNCLWFLMTS
jgi:hypothetical protein